MQKSTSPGDPLGAKFRLPIRLALIAYWVALFVGTHIPTVPAGVAEVSDKLLHYLAYGGLAGLMALDRFVRGRLSTSREAWRVLGLLWLILAIYGAVDELLQSPVGRTTDFGDWLADVIGAACGLALFGLVLAVARGLRRGGA